MSFAKNKLVQEQSANHSNAEENFKTVLKQNNLKTQLVKSATNKSSPS